MRRTSASLCNHSFSVIHDAVLSLQASSFPTASVLFAEENRATSLVTRRLEPADAVGEVLLGQNLQSPHRDSSSLRLYALTTNPLTSTGTPSLWRQLHERYSPRPNPTVPGGYPRCSEVAGAPLLTPHAVVYIGGFEQPDLRLVVLPTFLEHVPRLVDVPVNTVARRSTGSGTPGLSRGRRGPMYERQKFFLTQALADKGCTIHGSDLLELSLTIPVSEAAPQRHRTFITVANPASTLSQLRREVNSNRRSALRTAFGYSEEILQQALPPPMVAAALVLRAWQSFSTHGREISTAWWTSFLAHLVDHHTEFLLSAMDQEAVKLLSSDPSMGTPDEEENSEKKVHRTAVVAEALASSALRALTTEGPWLEDCLHNYFLPVETFDCCEETQRLLASRRDLAVDVFRSTSLRRYVSALRRIQHNHY